MRETKRKMDPILNLFLWVLIFSVPALWLWRYWIIGEWHWYTAFPTAVVLFFCTGLALEHWLNRAERAEKRAAERAKEERPQLERKEMEAKEQLERKKMEAEESAARDLVKTPRVRSLINELVIIAEKSQFQAEIETSEHSKRWGGAAKHIRAREIGEELQRLGGVSLMLEVHAAVISRVAHYPHARDLEWCWHDIDWRWGA